MKILVIFIQRLSSSMVGAMRYSIHCVRNSEIILFWMTKWVQQVRANLFTRGSHHRNLTVIYLVQNVYNHGKCQRTISLNSHYSVVFCNGRDASQFRTMAYQICPSDARWLLDAFTNATSKPYGYLVLDHHPSTPEDHTVVTNILPGEQLTYYINKHPKLTSK